MIQDDARENQLVKLFKLKQTSDRKRSDIDAFLDINGTRINFELKSTTVRSVSTASPLTLKHLIKWKNFHWIVGIYDKKTEKLKYCYYGSPKDMKKWILDMQIDIERGIKISKLFVDKIDKNMLYEIFGKKRIYTYKEAKTVYRKLFTKKQYMALKDTAGGYSPNRMLEMFKHHNWYYLEKGSWLNNPKIGPKTYRKWKKINKAYAKNLIKLLKDQKWVKKKDKKIGNHQLVKIQPSVNYVKKKDHLPSII